MEFTWCFFWCILIPISFDGCSSSRFCQASKHSCKTHSWRSGGRGRMSCGPNLVSSWSPQNPVVSQWSQIFWRILKLQWSDFSNLCQVRMAAIKSAGKLKECLTFFAGFLKQPKGCHIFRPWILLEITIASTCASSGPLWWSTIPLKLVTRFH